MMNVALPRWSRVVLAVAALALGAAYVLPLWTVTLQAPQYPEGLGMHIWINTVTGIKPEDLGNINGLNHYIGMKTIEPDSIAELTFMPYALGVLIALGLTAAAIGRRWALWGFAAVFLLGALAGIVDFWLWEYDYGHNLDLENAAIKIPGMAYQPPLIGSKQLLNFVATSWPAAGGAVAIAALLVVVGLVIADCCAPWPTAARRAARAAAASTTLRTAVGLVAVLATAGCTPETPHQLDASVACTHCRMAVADPRFAAQVRTETGKMLGFDSIECMAQWLGADPGTVVQGIWVTDALHPERVLEAHRAVLLEGGAVRSPMGGRLVAVEAGPDADRWQRELGATRTAWAEVGPRYAPHLARQ
ncbi:MAG: nitrous oxide reductase accessory protein NosL [Gemmatimonadaceae bacterium]|nr:nitrous oxide reductase accessory protein NosL [Gemmatimonadaceae bacterium]